jgi:hypothetical protein
MERENTVRALDRAATAIGNTPSLKKLKKLLESTRLIILVATIIFEF